MYILKPTPWIHLLGFISDDEAIDSEDAEYELIFSEGGLLPYGPAKGVPTIPMTDQSQVAFPEV